MLTPAVAGIREIIRQRASVLPHMASANPASTRRRRDGLDGLKTSVVRQHVFMHPAAAWESLACAQHGKWWLMRLLFCVLKGEGGDGQS